VRTIWGHLSLPNEVFIFLLSREWTVTWAGFLFFGTDPVCGELCLVKGIKCGLGVWGGQLYVLVKKKTSVQRFAWPSHYRWPDLHPSSRRGSVLCRWAYGPKFNLRSTFDRRLKVRLRPSFLRFARLVLTAHSFFSSTFWVCPGAEWFLVSYKEKVKNGWSSWRGSSSPKCTNLIQPLSLGRVRP